MARVTRAFSGFAAMLTLLALAPIAGARPGDILVTDNAEPDLLVRVNPATGAQSIAAQEGLLEQPMSVTSGLEGKALVVDRDAFGGTGGVVLVNLFNGAQSELASNAKSAAAGGPQLFFDPLGIAITPNNRLIVTDRGPQIGNQADGRVIIVNANTGRQRLLTEGLNLRNPFGIVLRSNGRILVSDVGQGIGGGGRIVGINPTTGAQAVFAQQNLLDLPRGLAVYPNGTIYASDEFDGQVVRIRPGGAQSQVTAGGELERPFGLAREPRGTLVASDWNGGGPGKLVRVNPFANSQSLLSPGADPQNFLNNNLGAAVIPPICGERFATAYGTPRRDTIKATRFRDVIHGLGGNDRILGFGGGDLICGGAGSDQISGGGGGDQLFGGRGGDRLIGGRSKDRCVGGPGRDRELSC